MGKGDKKTRKGKRSNKSYGKCRLRDKSKLIARRLKYIHNRYIANVDIDEEMQYLNEYLRNGGLEKIQDLHILRGILDIKFNNNQKVIPETVSPFVKVFSKGIYQLHLMGPVVSTDKIENYSTFIQKSKYFDQCFIETEDDFEIFYKHYEYKKDWLFRGVNESKFRLINYLQREWIEKRIYNKKISYIEFVGRLIDKALGFNNGLLSDYFKALDINVKNPLAILSFLQHYRCPTPLLDWTSDFKTSLFFAVSGVKPRTEERRIDDYFSVYALEERHMVGGNLKELINSIFKEVTHIVKPVLIDKVTKLGFSESFANEALPEKSVQKIAVQSFGQSFFEQKLMNLSFYMDESLFYFSDNDKYSNFLSLSLNNNINIIQQNGVFFWNSFYNQPYEEVGVKNAIQNGIGENYKFCKCYNINKKLDKHIELYLSQKGISETYIYPEQNKIKFEQIAKSIYDELLQELG